MFKIYIWPCNAVTVAYSNNFVQLGLFVYCKPVRSYQTGSESISHFRTPPHPQLSGASIPRRDINLQVTDSASTQELSSVPEENNGALFSVSGSGTLQVWWSEKQPERCCGSAGGRWVGATYWNAARRGVSLNPRLSEGEILTDGDEDRRPAEPADLPDTQMTLLITTLLY